MKLLPLLLATATLALSLPLPAEITKDAPPANPAAADAQREGGSYAKAVRATSVDFEYQWLKQRYPGHKVRKQTLRFNQRKPYDILAITTKDGQDFDVYFDISAFFGK